MRSSQSFCVTLAQARVLSRHLHSALKAHHFTWDSCIPPVHLAVLQKICVILAQAHVLSRQLHFTFETHHIMRNPCLALPHA